METGPDAVLYSSWLPVVNKEEELHIMSFVLTALGENPVLCLVDGIEMDQADGFVCSWHSSYRLFLKPVFPGSQADPCSLVDYPNT